LLPSASYEAVASSAALAWSNFDYQDETVSDQLAQVAVYGSYVHFAGFEYGSAASCV